MCARLYNCIQRNTITIIILGPKSGAHSLKGAAHNATTEQLLLEPVTCVQN